MNSISIKDLKAGSYFDKPVFLDSNYIILSPETPISSLLIRDLMEWEYRELLTDGNSRDSAPKEESKAETPKENGDQRIVPANDDKEKVKQVSEYYITFSVYVDQIFTKYVTKNELPIQDISERIRDLCEVIKESRRFILRVRDEVSEHRNYLVSHTVRSTIFAIVLGSYLKIPNHRLIELGVTCMLHEIGMVRLPPQLYMTDKPLGPQERKSIVTHPVIGYNILRGFNFPLAICLGSLEHHERMNGSGYPRALTGEKISLYSRIIGLVCSYDAVTSSRPYKAARDGYSGMLDILKNTGKQYDEQIIKAFVYSLSIYPIGSYVLLSNAKAGLVVDVNPENPRCPVVSILGAETPDGKESLIQTQETGIRILRIIQQVDADKLAKGKAE